MTKNVKLLNWHKFNTWKCHENNNIWAICQLDIETWVKSR